MVTRLIESARRKPIDPGVPEPRREITRTVKIVMNRARSLPVAAALALIAAAFLAGVMAGDRRETHAIAPIFVPAPVPAAAPPASIADEDTGFDLRVSPAGAAVVLDGRAIGAAPLRVRNLTPGVHVLELSAKGYFARRLSVALEAGNPKELEVALDRLEPEAPEPRDRAAGPRGKGTLKIGSKPPCRVLVDGRDVGTTPEMLELAAGRHAVSLVNDTYAIRERIRVTIKPGETVKVLRDYSEQLESSAD